MTTVQLWNLIKIGTTMKLITPFALENLSVKMGTVLTNQRYHN